MHPADELTTVATFTNTAEAELARERLELEGLAAYVVGAVTAHIIDGAIALQVPTESAAQAREILGLPG